MTAAKDFADSAFWMVHADGWRLVVSRRLGGALCVQWKAGGQHYDLGYEARLADSRRVSSAHWQGGPVAEAADDRLRIEGVPFQPVSDSLPLVRWMVPFQVVTSALTSGWAAERFQKAVKARMVRPKGMARLRLWRTIAVTEGRELSIIDEIRTEGGDRSVAALTAAREVPFYSPSARQEPAAFLCSGSWDGTAAAEALNRQGLWRRERCLAITADALRLLSDSA